MAVMTEEEAWELEERWNKNPPNVLENGTGFFAKRRAAKGSEAHLFTIDTVSARYILARATAAHSTPENVIKEMVLREMASARP
jgi:hypothetical protein